MSDDAELLRRYAAHDSETAFAELVHRHVNLVYSAALRLVNGDTHRAQDVTQQVFTELARQAKRLTKHPALLGWLYTTTRLMALRAIRTEQRRQAREQEANVMNELSSESNAPADWEHLRPVLEDAMHTLGEKDRLALLLRFFQNKSLRDIGAALGLNENAARMRVDRALEKLRAQLARQGVTSTASALALVLAGNAVTAAPSAFAASVASVSLAGAAKGTGTAVTLLKFIAMTKTQFSITALVLTGAAVTMIVQHQSQSELREQNRSLQQQLAQLRSDNEALSGRLADTRTRAMPHFPVPVFQTTAPNPPLENLQSTNLYARLNGNQPKLTADQVGPYLAANGRSAASLLAAYRTSGDPALLAEAMQKYPNDPHVAFEAAFKRDSTPEDRHQWLEIMKKSDAENALPNYLLALDYFKSGQSDQAVQELIAASGKPGFQDYTQDRMQDDEEAYLAAGYSVAEAKTIPGSQLLLPQLRPVKDLGLNLIDLSKAYRQAGDDASAQAALQMAANLGQRYKDTPGETEISWLVGMAVENMALKAMDPNSPYGNGGQTVQDRLNQLAQKKEEMKQLNAQLEHLLPMMTDQDWIIYKDRWHTFGEASAIRWVVNKYGQTVNSNQATQP